MTGQKMKPQNGKHKTSGLGDLRESKKRLGDAVKGKTVVFVVDEREREDYSVLFSHMFEEIGVDTNSRVLGYPSFLSDPKDLTADVLVLHSSRRFEFSMDEVHQSLKMFRENNPKSAVVVCYGIEQYADKVVTLVDSGLADAMQLTLTLDINDYDLVRMGAEILKRKQGE